MTDDEYIRAMTAVPQNICNGCTSNRRRPRPVTHCAHCRMPLSSTFYRGREYCSTCGAEKVQTPPQGITDG